MKLARFVFTVIGPVLLLGACASSGAAIPVASLAEAAPTTGWAKLSRCLASPRWSAWMG